MAAGRWRLAAGGFKNPAALPATGPNSSQPISPASPSAPGTPSNSPSSRPADQNGINVETLRYVESFGDNSTHKSPHSANLPQQSSHAERGHLASHRVYASQLPLLSAI